MTIAPRGWRNAFLRDVCTPIPVTSQANPAPILTFKGLRPDGRLSLLSATAGRFALALPGDIVFTKQGHVSGWVLKKVGIITESTGPIHVASTLQVVRPNDEIEPRWLYRWLMAPTTFDLVQEMVGARSSLTSATLRNIPIPLPERSTQKIVLEQLEDHLSRLQAAAAYLSDAGRRCSRLGASWVLANVEGQGVETQLSQVVLETKTGWDRGRALATEPPSGHPYLRMNHIRPDGRLDLSTVTHVSGDDTEAARYRVRVGDVLFNNRNSPELVGKTAMADSRVEGWTYNNNLVRIRFAPEVEPAFAVMQMNAPAFRSRVASSVSASTNVAAIYTRDLLRQSIWLPSRQRQAAMADEYDNLVRNSDRTVRSIADHDGGIARLRRSLLATAFKVQLIGKSTEGTVEEEMTDV